MGYISRIRQKREKIGMTQKELADLLDVSQGMISKWENSVAFPDFPKLKKLSKIFKCPIDDLYKEGK